MNGDAPEADWQRRVVSRSLRTARARSIDRGTTLVRAASALLERSGGDDFTVQDVADEAGQSLRTLYQYFGSKDDLLLAVFEEAMTVYARQVRDAVAELDDPLERLAGALITIARLPDLSGAGVKGGLSRLRLKLIEVEPELVGRARAPVVSLLCGLVEAAAAAGAVDAADPQTATYLLMSLNTASITSSTLGNDVGARAPEPEQIAGFCLRGLGADMAADWYRSIGARLRMPAVTRRSRGPTPAASA